MRIVVTGASGLLGRSIMKILAKDLEGEHIGLARSRVSGELKALDLTEKEGVEAFIRSQAPDLIIHSAAVRTPDTCENDHATTDAINVEATATLAGLAAGAEIPIIYLSTDYVFPGNGGAPYSPDSPTGPLNYYGTSKLNGELAVTQSGARHVILRVPVLYGEVESMEESAVTVIARALVDPTKPARLDDWASRYPTHVEDVASVIAGISEKLMKDPSWTGGIYHHSGDECLTKYQMAKIMAEELGVSSDHLTGDDQAPAGPPRPKDTRLDHSTTEKSGLNPQRSFREAIGPILKAHWNHE